MIEYPRVASLTYRINPLEVRSFLRLEDAAGSVGEFEYRVEENVIIFTPRVRFATVESAMQALAPLLRSWEVGSTLTFNRRSMKFVFQTAVVDPSAHLPGEGRLSGVAAMAFAGNVTVTVDENFPAPMLDFAVDDFVAALVEMHLLAFKVPSVLLHMCYSAITLVKLKYGEEVGEKLNISNQALRRFQAVASNRGAGVEARKVVDKLNPPLTDAERSWMADMLRDLAVRTGREVAGVDPGPQKTLEGSPEP